MKTILEPESKNEADVLDESSLGLRVDLRPGGHLGGSGEPAPVEEADYPRFCRLATHAAMASVCAQLADPEPALTAVRRRMVHELGEGRELALDAGEVDILVHPGARRPAGLRGVGRAVGRLLPATALPLQLREGAWLAAETLVEGYLLQLAARGPGALRPAGRSPERVREVRAAIDATLERADLKGIQKEVGKSFRGEADVLARAGGVLAERLGAGLGEDAAVHETERFLDGLAGDLASELWSDEPFFESLERTFLDRLPRAVS
jgi:hypothetical protein